VFEPVQIIENLMSIPVLTLFMLNKTFHFDVEQNIFEHPIFVTKIYILNKIFF